MKNIHRGVMWMLIATLCFSIMGTCVKLGSEFLSTDELVFYRSIINLLIVYFMMRLTNVNIATQHTSLHLKRSIIGFISLILFFYAIANLHLGTAMALNYTSPLFVGILMPWILKKHAHRKLLFAIILGFLGIFLILKPTINNNEFFAGLVGLLSGIGAGAAYLYVAKLGQVKEPLLRTVFYFALISTLGSGTLMLREEVSSISLASIPIILILGVSATIAQLSITKAYKVGNTLGNAGLSYLTVVFSILFGVIFFREIPDYFGILGIILIIMSGMIASINDTKAQASRIESQ